MKKAQYWHNAATQAVTTAGEDLQRLRHGNGASARGYLNERLRPKRQRSGRSLLLRLELSMQRQ
ncbi:hypothetical protein [Corynebacterium ulcerans]|uniref:hypothetical protein n=1 Tax=Corynebacterium ulcerans TaxID=65058 RepID=UPI0015E0A3FC|nr:hypothetical protein [Corynebacterium ulcerans]